jgi:hypothetical protein
MAFEAFVAGQPEPLGQGAWPIVRKPDFGTISLTFLSVKRAAIFPLTHIECTCPTSHPATILIRMILPASPHRMMREGKGSG